MEFFIAFQTAFALLLSGDATVAEIITLSMQVSIISTIAALCLGLPLGALLATCHFTGRQVIITLLNTMLSMPPVVIGLLVYLMISRAGPFGFLELLYTAPAMMIAQFILVFPISAALSRQIFENLDSEYSPLFGTLHTPLRRRVMVLIYDARLSLITVGLACFGRAISEVGAVIIVGGNIAHVTRVMTTAIALETSRGELSRALALGIVLMLIALLVNSLSSWLRIRMEKAGAHV